MSTSIKGTVKVRGAYLTLIPMRLSPPSDPYPHPNLQPFISIFHSTPLLPFAIASRNPPRSCYKIHIHILNSTSISFPPQLTPSLPLSNSFVIHRLAFLLLSAFYSIVFLYFMLNPNHLPLITSFHYSPL